ncbi:MAG: sulfatase-like hydrolase/transferase [Minicystis sp.]
MWLILLGLFHGLAVATCSVSAADRPNILFCFADDWGRYASAYAALETRPSPNQVIRTPHIDRIAREGTLFRNAFVCAPSCTPCRSSLLSGRYFFNCGRGAILVGAEWDSAIPSFPLLLKDHGYHIGETWKVWSPGTPNDAPFGAGKYAYERGNLPNNFSENVTKMTGEGISIEAAREKVYEQVRVSFREFLSARKGQEPWLYWCGPTTVHRTWVKGSGKALWGIDPEQLHGKLPKFLPDVPEVREDFADYLGEAQAFDAYVGLLVEMLEKAGRAREHGDRRERRSRGSRLSGRQVQPLRLRDGGGARRPVPGTEAGPGGRRLRQPDGPRSDVPSRSAAVRSRPG